MNASSVLKRAGVDPTPNRVAVYEAVAAVDNALTAGELIDSVAERRPMNRVTVYRILDLLVDRGVILKHSSADRSFRFCAGAGGTAHAHAHFHCHACGETACLPMEDIGFDPEGLAGRFDVQVDSVEIRIDGLCARCRKDV